VVRHRAGCRRHHKRRDADGCCEAKKGDEGPASRTQGALGRRGKSRRRAAKGQVVLPEALCEKRETTAGAAEIRGGLETGDETSERETRRREEEVGKARSRTQSGKEARRAVGQGA